MLGEQEHQRWLEVESHQVVAPLRITGYQRGANRTPSSLHLIRLRRCVEKLAMTAILHGTFRLSRGERLGEASAQGLGCA
jgi:hypothetical protein